MSARKHRLPVVLDTNVFVRNFKAKTKSSANRRVIRLWLLEKRLQIVVSPEIVVEYLAIFDQVLRMAPEIVSEWRERFDDDPRVTKINLAYRHSESCDPDDNVFLSTALAGKAKFLITNDRDLLDLPTAVQDSLSFTIVKPEKFLAMIDEDE